MSVQGIYGNRENAGMTGERHERLRNDWIQWIYEDNLSSRIFTFDYDSSQLETGINNIGRFREMAMQLLDGLVKLRGKPDLVAV